MTCVWTYFRVIFFLSYFFFSVSLFGVKLLCGSFVIFMLMSCLWI